MLVMGISEFIALRFQFHFEVKLSCWCSLNNTTREAESSTSPPVSQYTSSRPGHRRRQMRSIRRRTVLATRTPRSRP